MSTAQVIYTTTIATMPPSERLRLARLILDGLSDSTLEALNYSDEWSEEDMRDVAAYSARCAAESFGEERE